MSTHTSKVVNTFDFIDFGCSDGQSIGLARTYFGGKEELGLDLSPIKVEKARAAGFNAMQADITTLTATTSPLGL